MRGAVVPIHQQFISTLGASHSEPKVLGDAVEVSGLVESLGGGSPFSPLGPSLALGSPRWPVLVASRGGPGGEAGSVRDVG